MKCPKILFMLALVMTFSTSLAEEEFLLGNDDEDIETLETSDIPFNLPETLEPTSLRGTSRFLAQTPPRARMTCDKYPRVCHAKGSTGPDCCKTKCVDVKTDRLNCGMCGKKCKYSEICCKGKCVNPWNDNKHCGGCNNKCKKGRSCVYGMCSYA